MRRLAVLSALALSACATALEAPPHPAAQTSLEQALGHTPVGGRAHGAELTRRVAEAERHPLGSRENPVRTGSPQDQRAYLARLLCSDGVAPEFRRIGDFGPGVYGSVIDGYEVRCLTGEPRERIIFMDMHHPGHDETRAPTAYRIVPVIAPRSS